MMAMWWCWHSHSYLIVHLFVIFIIVTTSCVHELQQRLKGPLLLNPNSIRLRDGV